jgi:hypothetical protein
MREVLMGWCMMKLLGLIWGNAGHFTTIFSDATKQRKIANFQTENVLRRNKRGLNYNVLKEYNLITFTVA